MTLRPGHPPTGGLRQHLPPPPPHHLAPVHLHLPLLLCPADRLVLLDLGVPAPGLTPSGEPDRAVGLLPVLTPPLVISSPWQALSHQHRAPDLLHQDLTLSPGPGLAVGGALLHLLLPAGGLQLQPDLLAGAGGGGGEEEGEQSQGGGHLRPGSAARLLGWEFLLNGTVTGP